MNHVSIGLDMLPYTTPKIPQQPLSEKVLSYTHRLMNGERGRSQHVLFLSHCPECALAFYYISWTVSSLTVFFHLGEEWGGTNVFPVIMFKPQSIWKRIFVRTLFLSLSRNFTTLFIVLSFLNCSFISSAINGWVSIFPQHFWANFFLLFLSFLPLGWSKEMDYH